MGLIGKLERTLSDFGRLKPTKPKAPRTQKQLSSRRKIMFFCETQENSHGVPVVMNNIAQGLRETDSYDVYMLINNFDRSSLALYLPTERRPLIVQDREELSRVACDLLADIDILHIHSWHFADPFVYFHTQRHNTLSAAQFLRSFPKAKIVFTDHSNPTEDLDTLVSEHSIRLETFSPKARQDFLTQTCLREHDPRYTHGRWRNGWCQTSILGREQMYDLADVVTHVSQHQWDVNRQLALSPPHEEKHRIVYNGIDLLRYASSATLSTFTAELASRYRTEHTQKLLLYSGRATEAKGFYDLLDALVLLKNKKPNLNFKLLIATNTANIQHDIETRYGLIAQNIVFLPYIQDREFLAAHYNLVDLVIQPTHGECFNQVIGEALAFGTPTITTDFSGPKEIYVDSGVSYGVPVRNPHRLAETIEHVLSHEDEAREMANKGQAYIQKTLSVAAMNKQYLEIYDALLSSPIINGQHVDFYQERIDALTKAIKKEPDNSLHYLFLLRELFYKNNGDVTEGEAEYAKEAIFHLQRLHQTSLAYQLADTYIKQHKYKPAEFILAKMVADHVSFAPAYISLAHIVRAQNTGSNFRTEREEWAKWLEWRSEQV